MTAAGVDGSAAAPLTVEAVDDVLAIHAVDVGRPESRRERAARLVSDGMTAAQLDVLVQWATQTRRKLSGVGQWLRWATDAARWRFVVRDVERSLAAHQAKAPAKPAPRVVDVEDRNAGIAYARVVADRAGVDLVASELGLTADRVRDLVAVETQRRNRDAAAWKSKPRRAAQQLAPEVQPW